MKRIICLLALLLITSLNISAKDNSATTSEQVKATQKFLPMRIDDNTTWVEIAGSKNSLIYFYQINDISDQQVKDAHSSIKNSVQTKLKDAYANNKGFAQLADKGVNFTYIYVNGNDDFITSFTFTPAEFNWFVEV